MPAPAPTRTHARRAAAAALVLAAAALASCGGSAPAPRKASATAASRVPVTTPRPRNVVTLSPAADAYVAVGAGEHGHGPTLRVDGSPLSRGYLDFDLSAVPGRVVRATLALYADTGSRTGYAVARGRGVRWSGQQRVAVTAAASRAARAGDPRSGGFRPRTWTSVDVTRLVRRRETVTLALLPLTPTEIRLASADDGAAAPRLVVRPAPPPGGRGAAREYFGRAAAARRSAPVLVAAGDIACDPAGARFRRTAGTRGACAMGATERLTRGLHPTAVLTLGDNQYENGTYAAFRRSFAPTWGRLGRLLHPAIGNHEYATPGAAGYFRYFGARAGRAGEGWYSFDLGAWHLVELNSECTHIGGCGAGSPEEGWLRADLAAHPAACTLAYWHEPRFSSGQHGDAEQMATIWNDLVAARADVVLNGHDHDYERFAPAGRTPPAGTQVGGVHSYQPPTRDPAGIREFVVGTGGRDHRRFAHAPLAGGAVRNDTAFGVLRLTLRAHGYAWRFVPAGGAHGAFTDSGSGSCH